MCLTPVSIPVYNSLGELQSYQNVPCNHCQECLAERRRHWTHRLYYENFFSLSSFFLTLTYDNEHLPLDGLSKRDCQLFFKRLRKRVGKFRYFLVSEYGDQFSRGHYHCLIFFNKVVRLSDIVRATESAWQNGFIKVGDVNVKSIQYCSKYCLKEKNDGGYSLNLETGEVVEHINTFSLMSRNPGIGSQLLSWPEWLKSHTKGDGVFKDVVFDKVVSLPRYYRDKIFTDLQKIKHRERIAEKYSGKGLDSFDQRARGREFLESINKRSRR